MKILLVILLIFCLILSALYIYNAYAVKTNKAAIDRYIKFELEQEQKKHTIEVDLDKEKETNNIEESDVLEL